jgi:hypothetical protein
MTHSLIASFHRLRVQLQIYLWRYGWVWPVLGVLLASAVMLHMAWLPAQIAESTKAMKNLERLQTQYQAVSKTPSRQAPLTREDDILVQLSERSYAESDVSLLLQLIAQMAQAKGLALTQSEFQTIQEGHGGLRQLQVTLPVRASYIQIRQFVQEILRQLGGVSVDQISIKRDNVAQNQVEARLKLSIWIDLNKPTSRVVKQP